MCLIIQMAFSMLHTILRQTCMAYLHEVTDEVNVRLYKLP